MRAGLSLVLAIFLAVSCTARALAHDEAAAVQPGGASSTAWPTTGWPDIKATRPAFQAIPASETMHVVPGGQSATVVTGSIDPNAATPPDADIGRAARALISVPNPAAPVVATLDPSPSPATDGAPTALAAQPIPPTPEEADQSALISFYTSRRDEPLWVTSTGYTARAQSVIEEIKNAGDWAFDPAAFELTALPANGASRDDLAKAEMSLSVAVLKYARYARGGRIPDPATTLSSYLDRRPQLRERSVLLAELAKSDGPAGILIGLHPQQAQFNLLRQAWLETQRPMSSKGLRLDTASDLRVGDRGPAVVQLRKRLNADAALPGDETLYDERLAGAVKGFQTLRDISPADGVVNTATRDALAKPSPKANPVQLAANLQMWRWMPEDLGKFYVTVNVPEYMIRVVKDGEPVFTERVTVGLVDKETPIFSDEMERVTFKSIWKVPDSIKVREIWPSLLRGGGLMRQHNLRIKRAGEGGEDVDWHRIDWSKANMADYDVYRPPGGGNQLGLVKFSFPSKHYVFMHDTPEKYMFNWTRRANSHGCMRVRNPLAMAAIVLGQDKGWDRAKIDDLVKNGPDHNVIELDKKIPVHITYFTARVAPGGRIETWDDIYGHEKRVTLALANKWDKIVRGRDHLAPLDQTTVPRVAEGPKRQPKAGDSTVQSLMSAMFGGL